MYNNRTVRSYVLCLIIFCYDVLRHVRNGVDPWAKPSSSIRANHLLRENVLNIPYIIEINE